MSKDKSLIPEGTYYKHENLTKPSEGYFKAKREVLDSLDGRINILNDRMNIEVDETKKQEYNIKIKTLEETRRHLKNMMGWYSGWGE